MPSTPRNSTKDMISLTSQPSCSVMGTINNLLKYSFIFYVAIYHTVCYVLQEVIALGSCEIKGTSETYTIHVVFVSDGKMTK